MSSRIAVEDPLGPSPQLPYSQPQHNNLLSFSGPFDAASSYQKLWVFAEFDS